MHLISTTTFDLALSVVVHRVALDIFMYENLELSVPLKLLLIGAFWCSAKMILYGANL